MKKIVKKTSTTIKKYEGGGTAKSKSSQKNTKNDRWKGWEDVRDKQRAEAMGKLKYLSRLHTTDLVSASRRGDKDPLKTAQGSIQGYEQAKGKGSFMRDVNKALSDYKETYKKGGMVKSKMSKGGLAKYAKGGMAKKKK